MADRYGVFLRPDPRTCAAVTAVAGQLRAQYGLVSAAAFPPHATLAGSLPLAGAEEELEDALSAALADVPPAPVENAGVWRHPEGVIVYDIHGLGGAPNAALVGLAERVDAAVRPLLGPARGLEPDTYQPGEWRAHLSLASHELFERADLRDEVEEYVRALEIPHPPRFTADTVALYRLAHPTWTGAWWEAMRWEHVRSWPLRSGPR